jgi:hypothetical protein
MDISTISFSRYSNWQYFLGAVIGIIFEAIPNSFAAFSILLLGFLISSKVERDYVKKHQ